VVKNTLHFKHQTVQTLSAQYPLKSPLHMHIREIAAYVMSRKPKPAKRKYRTPIKVYRTQGYRELFAENFMVQSMLYEGGCWGNSPMEGFFQCLRRNVDSRRVYEADR